MKPGRGDGHAARGSAWRTGPLRDLTRIAAWAVGLDTAVSIVGDLLAQHRGGSLAAQAFVAEWGAGRLGVAWSDPALPPPEGRALALRLCRGVAWGLGAGALTLGFAVATGAARFGAGRWSPAALGVSAFLAAVAAVRDELLLRGVVLRVFRHSFGPRGLLAVCAAVAVFGRAGELADLPFFALVTTRSGIVPLLAAGVAAVPLAALWLREGGAFGACGAHAAWTFATTTVVDGGLWDLRWADGAWGGGGRGLEGSTAVLAAASIIASGAAVALVRARS